MLSLPEFATQQAGSVEGDALRSRADGVRRERRTRVVPAQRRDLRRVQRTCCDAGRPAGARRQCEHRDHERKREQTRIPTSTA